MNSELDLNYFEQFTVKNHISVIIKQLYLNQKLQKKFQLKKLIQFENHVNILNSKQQLKKNIQNVSISDLFQQHSSCLLTNTQLITQTILNEQIKLVLFA